ncbi:MAG: FAD-dependent oxidoreductase, partial [Deltaproteobacteria bacterium]|nr:FAD-dependent oxidoreductase [Deltaproteobacteria bacterium]
NHVKVIAQEADIRIKIHGKDFVPLIGELSTRDVVEAINKFTNSKPTINFEALDKLREETAPLLPMRPPALCPGCPHRASYYVINAASQRVSSKNGIEPIFPGDIGCYGLGVNPPLESDDIAICMGGSFGIANGLAHVVEAPIVAHLGDSTFFHSGIPPMINAVYSGVNITMIVLDNATTAMTGFQPHPGCGYPGTDNAYVKIRPEDIARACGVKCVEVADPFDTQNAIDTVERAIEFEGASLVVLRRPCAIIEQREKKKRGESIFPYHIDEKKCVENSLPFCQATCPLHVDVKGYVGLIREESFDEAFKLVKQKLPFPGILGRVCTRPCENTCKRGDVDEPIAIASLHRSAADYAKESTEDLIIGEEKKEKIAIIGGGPAGIMAAHDLKKLGYQTTVFESLPVLGGMLSVGIPEYRLPRAILQQEMSLIEKLGVEIRLNTKIGRDITLSELRRDFDAVFVATGAHKGLGLRIENGDSDGVLDGIEFLRKFNLEEEAEVKDKVIIVGGGMVATDCARTCLRLGFKDVEIVYRRSRTEMPAIKEEVEQAEKEGVKIHFLAAPIKVLVKDGKITGIECIRIRLGDPDSSGRKRPIPIEGSEYVRRTDMIISAIGGQPDLGFLREGSEILSVTDDLIKADPVTLETNVSGVFAGGDAVTGPWTVIDALAAGRKAAISIDRFVKGEPLRINREAERVQTSHLTIDIEGIGHERRISMPAISEDHRCGSFLEVELGFNREEASKESERCLSCECNLCTKFLGCPALIQDQGQVKIDSSQCPGCGVCAHVCPNEAIISGENDVSFKRT